MEINFSNKKELYRRVLPALAHKKRELNKQGVEVREIDIFRKLSRKWSKEKKYNII